MNRTLALLISASLIVGCTQRMKQPAATQPTDPATNLANSIIHASGGNNWPKVDRVQFTFNVEQDGKTVVSRKHDWDVVKGTDTVTVGDKTTSVNVNSAPPADNADQMNAYKNWVNDSYWLLAPLKLRDPGVMLTHKGQQEIDGKKYDALHARFNNVGITTGDQYNFYVDPQTHMIRRWDYMPTPDRTVSGTWDDYQDFSGLKLSTNHTFGPRRIYFTDVKVDK